MGRGVQRRIRPAAPGQRPRVQADISAVRARRDDGRRRVWRVRADVSADARQPLPARRRAPAPLPAGRLLPAKHRGRRARPREVARRREARAGDSGRRPALRPAKRRLAARRPLRAAERAGALPPAADPRLSAAVSDGRRRARAGVRDGRRQSADGLFALLRRFATARARRAIYRRRQPRRPVGGAAPDFPSFSGRARGADARRIPAERRPVRRTRLPRYRSGARIQRRSAKGGLATVHIRRRRRSAQGELRASGRRRARLGLREPLGLPPGDGRFPIRRRASVFRAGGGGGAQADRVLLHAAGAGGGAGGQRARARHGRAPRRRADESGEGARAAVPARVRPRRRVGTLPARRRPPNRARAGESPLRRRRAEPRRIPKRRPRRHPRVHIRGGQERAGGGSVQGGAVDRRTRRRQAARLSRPPRETRRQPRRRGVLQGARCGNPRRRVQAGGGRRQGGSAILPQSQQARARRAAAHEHERRPAGGGIGGRVRQVRDHPRRQPRAGERASASLRRRADGRRRLVGSQDRLRPVDLRLLRPHPKSGRGRAGRDAHDGRRSKRPRWQANEPQAKRRRQRRVRNPPVLSLAP